MATIAGRAGPLAFCAALSLALHAALTSVIAPAAAGWRDRLPGTLVNGRAVQLVPAPARPSPAWSPPATQGAAPPLPQPTVSRASNDTRAVRPAARARTPVALEVPTPTAEPIGHGGLDDYLPRRLLTQAPTSDRPVELPYPSDGPLQGQYVAVATLYIDEHGWVRDVRFEGEPLPSALQETARGSFLAARFRAGEVEGQPVKSRIRIEVTFESKVNADSHHLPL